MNPWPGRIEQTQSTYDGGHVRGRHAFAWLLVALAAVVLVALAASFFFRPYTPMMTYYGAPFYGWGFFPFGSIFFIIFVFFVFRFVFWGWGGWGWRRGYGYSYGDAREILRQRYAKGEITKDQFEQMMRDLEQH